MIEFLSSWTELNKSNINSKDNMLFGLYIKFEMLNAKLLLCIIMIHIFDIQSQPQLEPNYANAVHILFNKF